MTYSVLDSTLDDLPVHFFITSVCLSSLYSGPEYLGFSDFYIVPVSNYLLHPFSSVLELQLGIMHVFCIFDAFLKHIF